MLLKISSSSSSGLSIPFPFSNSTSFHIVIPDQREHYPFQNISNGFVGLDRQSNGKHN
jgi:hypothetical protein